MTTDKNRKPESLTRGEEGDAQGLESCGPDTLFEPAGTEENRAGSRDT